MSRRLAPVRRRQRAGWLVRERARRAPRHHRPARFVARSVAGSRPGSTACAEGYIAHGSQFACSASSTCSEPDDARTTAGRSRSLSHSTTTITSSKYGSDPTTPPQERRETRSRSRYETSGSPCVQSPMVYISSSQAPSRQGTDTHRAATSSSRPAARPGPADRVTASSSAPNHWLRSPPSPRERPLNCELRHPGPAQASARRTLSFGGRAGIPSSFGSGRNPCSRHRTAFERVLKGHYSSKKQVQRGTVAAERDLLRNTVQGVIPSRLPRSFVAKSSPAWARRLAGSLDLAEEVRPTTPRSLLAAGHGSPRPAP